MNALKYWTNQIGQPPFGSQRRITTNAYKGMLWNAKPILKPPMADFGAIRSKLARWRRIYMLVSQLLIEQPKILKIVFANAPLAAGNTIQEAELNKE